MFFHSPFLVGDVVFVWLHVHVTCGTCGGEVSTDLAGLLCQVLEQDTLLLQCVASLRSIKS